MAIDVDKQVADLRTGDTILINGTIKTRVLSNHGRSGVLLKHPNGTTYAIRFSATTDRWWFGLSGHEDILVNYVRKT